MAIIITDRIREKLANKIPPVTEAEVRECFWNRTGKTLVDDREEHKTNPPTRWFIAETAQGRHLKIVFIRTTNGDHVLKSAYDPDEAEESIYERKAESKIDELVSDDTLWDAKQLGASSTHARAASIEDDKELDDDLGLAPISLRLQKDLVAKLKTMAKQEGLGYQTYIRQVLTRHVREASIVLTKKEPA